MSAMVDRETFSRYVAESLVRFNDRLYLESHPLAELFSQSGQPASGDSIQRMLRDAIERLCPTPQAAADMLVFRRYRHMILRYLEGKTLERTASELGVSVRQAHRDHLSARDAVAATLYNHWVRHTEGRESSHPPRRIATSSRPVERQKDVRVDDGDSAVAIEIDRMGAHDAREITHVEEVLRGVLTIIEPLAQSMGVLSEIQLSYDLAPVKLDRTAFRQLLLSLLSYAIEWQGARRLRISGTMHPSSLDLEIAADRWEGSHHVAGSEAESLLAAARRLADLQQCRLHIALERPGCTILRLSLPTAAETIILVIDDNPDLGRLFRRYLQGRDYRVVQATSAAQALRLAHDLQPQVILLDVLIPSHDGWDILQQLRSYPRTRGTSVIICSVLPEQGLARSLGVVEFLPKPVSAATLLSALERVRAAPPCK